MSIAGRPLNVALVGCGAIATHQHLPNLHRSVGTRLYICCDLDLNLAKQRAAEFGADVACDDYLRAVRDPKTDLVLISTTERIRLPIIQAAVEAGKPIYCEKPLATSLVELYAIRDLVRQSSVPLLIGHNRRSSPAMMAARKIFRDHMNAPKLCPWRWEREGNQRPANSFDGVAGMSVRVNDDWHSWKAWAMDPEHNPHGAMLFEMTHFTDLCNWFLDAIPTEVSAVSCGGLNHSATIRYATGEVATISMFANGTFGYPKELYECFGEGAAVVVDHMLEVRTAGIANAPPRIVFPVLGDRHSHVGRELGLTGWLAKKQAACEDVAAAGDPTQQFTAEPDKGQAHALERFAAQIRGDGPEVCSIDDAVLATEVSFAAIRAAKLRRIVTLDEIRESARAPKLEAQIHARPIVTSEGQPV